MSSLLSPTRPVQPLFGGQSSFVANSSSYETAGSLAYETAGSLGLFSAGSSSAGGSSSSGGSVNCIS